MIINIRYVVGDLFFFYSVNYSRVLRLQRQLWTIGHLFATNQLTKTFSLHSLLKHFRSLPEITRSEKLMLVCKQTTSWLQNFLLILYTLNCKPVDRHIDDSLC